jgi:hypothetical protein
MKNIKYTDNIISKVKELLKNTEYSDILKFGNISIEYAAGFYLLNNITFKKNGKAIYVYNHRIASEEQTLFIYDSFDELIDGNVKRTV